MIEILRKIIVNILTALYQPFGFAVILTILFMAVYIFAREYGWKEIVKRWIVEFKMSITFRRLFLLTFYTAMILFRTLLTRYIWENPLANVIGTWGLYSENGELTTECLENIALFTPFTVLLLWSLQEKVIEKKSPFFLILWKSVQITFLFSLMIELAQLFFRLGTFQLSDLFYNTLGGFLGGLIYWCGYKLTHRKQD